MTEHEVRKGGGGRLTRSETVTVRLDPKLRYLAELAARKQRRTLSSFIEWAIEDSLKSVLLYQCTGYDGDNESVSVADASIALWDVDEAERFVRLAIRYSELLTHQEQEIWKLLLDSSLLLPAQSRRANQLMWDFAVLEDKVFPTIRTRWAGLMTAYAGSTSERSDWVARTKAEMLEGKIYPKSPSSYGSTQPRRAPPPSSEKTGFADMDDDIPF